MINPTMFLLQKFRTRVVMAALFVFFTYVNYFRVMHPEWWPLDPFSWIIAGVLLALAITLVFMWFERNDEERINEAESLGARLMLPFYAGALFSLMF